MLPSPRRIISPISPCFTSDPDSSTNLISHCRALRFPMLPALVSCASKPNNVPLGPASVGPYTHINRLVENFSFKKPTSCWDNGAPPYTQYSIDVKSYLLIFRCCAVVRYATCAPKKCVVFSFSTVLSNKSGENAGAST